MVFAGYPEKEHKRMVAARICSPKEFKVLWPRDSVNPPGGRRMQRWLRGELVK